MNNITHTNDSSISTSFNQNNLIQLNTFLPPEIWAIIFSYVHSKDVPSICSTSKQFNYLIKKSKSLNVQKFFEKYLIFLCSNSTAEVIKNNFTNSSFGYLESIKKLNIDRKIYSHTSNIFYENGVYDIESWNKNDRITIFKRAAELGHLKIIKELIKNRLIDPSIDQNYAIKAASKYGHEKTVKFLLKDKRVDPSHHNNYALKIAAANGFEKVAKILMEHPKVDHSINYNVLLNEAAKNKNIKIVKLLVKQGKVEHITNINEAIHWAAFNGDIKSLKLLLDGRDVNYQIISNLIELAKTKNHSETEEFLIKILDF